MDFDVVGCVRTLIEKHQLIPAYTKVVVGVSGGLDSVCLAYILKQLVPDYGWQLVLAHFNHKQRKWHSDQDVLWVKDLAQQWNLPCVVGFLPQPLQGQNSAEDTLRKQRYAFLEEVAKTHKASFLAVGHHQGDQAETVLHHLIRGTHLQGLRGMRLKRCLSPGSFVLLVRPLLRLLRADLEQYAKREKLDWCEDESNADARYTRNRIRHEVIPLLEMINPQVLSHMNRLANLAEELSDELDCNDRGWFQDLGTSVKGESVLDLNQWGRLKPLRQNEVLFRLLQRYKPKGQEITGSHVQELAKLCRSRKSWIEVEFMSGLWCFKSYDWIKMATSRHRDCDTSEESFGFTRREFVRSSEDLFTLSKEKNRMIYCDAAKIEGELQLLKADLDEVFCPLGMASMKTLKSYCSDHKIPHWERSRLYVLRDDEKVIWLCGYRMDDRIKCDLHTKNVLHLQLNLT